MFRISDFFPARVPIFSEKGEKKGKWMEEKWKMDGGKMENGWRKKGKWMEEKRMECPKILIKKIFEKSRVLIVQLYFLWQDWG